MTKYARSKKEAYEALREIGASPDIAQVMLNRVDEWKTYTIGDYYICFADGAYMVQNMKGR